MGNSTTPPLPAVRPDAAGRRRIIQAVDAWETGGGAPEHLSRKRWSSPAWPRREEMEMTGTVNQIDWAGQIKARVDGEFDRVAKALESTASKQVGQDRMDTRAVIAILEEKRAGVMVKEQAGYFIQHWRELSDQVRQMITQDSQYQAIKANRARR